MIRFINVINEKFDFNDIDDFFDYIVCSSDNPIYFIDKTKYAFHINCDVYTYEEYGKELFIGKFKCNEFSDILDIPLHSSYYERCRFNCERTILFLD